MRAHPPRRSIVAWAAWLLALAPCAAQGHGFAQRYDLPVPLGLYLGASAAAVALSFVVVAFFVRGARVVRAYPRFNLLVNPAAHNLAATVTTLLRFVSVAVLALVIAGGLVGPDDPFRNIAPTAIWVIWWVGLAYVSGLAGNLWALVNPWAAVFEWAGNAWRRLFPGGHFGLSLPWPAWLGRGPAIVLFAGFVWAELIWPQSDEPASLARAALAYSIVTWLGMFLFGRHAWLANGEAFSVAFAFLARFAPCEIRVTDSTLCAACATTGCCDRYAACVNCLACFEQASRQSREFNLRPWAVGLLGTRPVSASSTIFVLLMLSSVTFDGLLATPLWSELADRMLHSQGFRPLIIALQDVTGDAVAAAATLALVLFVAGFQVLYLLFSAVMRWCLPAAQRADLSLRQVAGLFVLSLVPIALAYHLAHYLSYLAIVGQYMIPLASDPFGLGWNLFGTRLYRVDISVVNARMIWYTSVLAIVAGHIVAVWLGHVTALRAFASNRAALRSQVPMLVLMVGYTILSLWILAQPVVETG